MSRPAWRRLGLRARLTLLATGAVAVALVIGSVLSVRLLGYALVRTVDDAARRQAVSVADLVRDNAVPDPLPVTGAAAAVQVLDGRGRVLASSAGGDRLAALLSPAQLATARTGTAVALPGARIGLDGPLRVLARPADLSPAPADARTVLVAVSVVDVARSARLLALAALVGVPVLVALFALLSWRLLGSALRPVTALRAGADRITAAGSGDRLPVPVARDEVAELARTLNRMLDRLAAAAGTRRAFVADAAHELRNPLAAIRSVVEVDLAHPSTADPARTAADVLADLDRLDRLVADLLVLARIDESGPRTGRAAEEVDLAALAATAAGARARAAVPVDFDGDGPAPVRGDPVGLRRVVDNLLDNAVRHARTRVLATVRSPAGAVELTVTDDGPGIAAADRDRVFDRFTRLDDARDRDAGGSGLGLAIVAATVGAHGGTVRLGDAGPGLLVRVELPGAGTQSAVSRWHDRGPERSGRPESGGSG